MTWELTFGNSIRNSFPSKYDKRQINERSGECHARAILVFDIPIRFDFLDAMGGGKLSFQVPPLTEYIQQYFGMHYTPDEIYYLLDAGPNGRVFLGLSSAPGPGKPQ